MHIFELGNLIWLSTLILVVVEHADLFVDFSFKLVLTVLKAFLILLDINLVNIVDTFASFYWSFHTSNAFDLLLDIFTIFDVIIVFIVINVAIVGRRIDIFQLIGVARKFILNRIH